MILLPDRDGELMAGTNPVKVFWTLSETLCPSSSLAVGSAYVTASLASVLFIVLLRAGWGAVERNRSQKP